MSIDTHYYNAEGTYRPAQQTESVDRSPVQIVGRYWIRLTKEEVNNLGVMSFFVFHDRIYVPVSVAKTLGIV